jgi:hypothetical protein
MQLSVTPPSGSSLGVADSPNCESKFVDRLINGCDGDASLNPYNSKYGGNLTTWDGWVCTFAPPTNQVLASQYQTQYEFSVDWLDIRGNNWDRNKLGDKGEKLKSEMEEYSIM